MSGGGWKDVLLGGWDVTNVTLLETGPWQTPSISAAADQSEYRCGEPWCGDSAGCGLEGLLRRGSRRAQYFNLAAFAATPAGAGRFGNAGVGILQGPGTAAVSLGVAKVFPITERVHARFESTFTNVLNHTNFAPPATVVDSPSTFGTLIGPQTSENAGNRTGQLALRVDF